MFALLEKLSRATVSRVARNLSEIKVGRTTVMPSSSSVPPTAPWSSHIQRDHSNRDGHLDAANAFHASSMFRPGSRRAALSKPLHDGANAARVVLA